MATGQNGASGLLMGGARRNGGAGCPSSNARAVLTWALDKGPSGPSERGAQGEKVLFFPDQHLGRNTGVQLGYELDDMRVWDPRRELGGLDEREVKESTLLLWKGHCSVHQRFTAEHIEAFRARHHEGIVIAHPECSHDVVQLADQVGSTDFIIKAIEAAPPGSHVAVATEIHLVQRLAAEHPEVTVESLDPLICPCSTMFRIDAKHLAWILEGLVQGEVRNQITVDADTAGWARVALERMLDIT